MKQRNIIFITWIITTTILTTFALLTFFFAVPWQDNKLLDALYQFWVVFSASYTTWLFMTKDQKPKGGDKK